MRLVTSILAIMSIVVTTFAVADVFRVGVISIDKLILAGVLLLLAFEFHKMRIWQESMTTEEVKDGLE